MFRSLHVWIPAVAFLAAIGVASVAVATQPGDPVTTPASPAVATPETATTIEATTTPPAAAAVLDIPAPSSEPRPTGILTYLTGDGSYVAVDAADPSSTFDVVEPASSAARPGGDRYPSPDGRYVASVRRDADGVALEVHDGTRQVFSRQIAGPNDPDPIADPKAAARAIEGVPLRVAWSPDGKYLTFGSINSVPFALGIIRTDTWSATVREVVGGYVGELAWAPDSSQLAISTYEIDRRDHTVLIYDPSRMTVRRLIDGCAIVWAPDAAFLAIHREPSVASGVWITSPDGGTPIEATGDELAFPIAWTATVS